jgi:hypothetical protein
MGTGVPFPGVKAWRGHDADHSPPSSAEVKNEQELYLLSPHASPWRVAGSLYLFTVQVTELVTEYVHITTELVQQIVELDAIQTQVCSVATTPVCSLQRCHYTSLLSTALLLHKSALYSVVTTTVCSLQRFHYTSLLSTALPKHQSALYSAVNIPVCSL